MSGLFVLLILLPRAENGANPFAGQEFDPWKQAPARRFEGITAYLQAPAEGIWRGSTQAGRDDIFIFEVMTEEVDLPDWRRRQAELERRFRQEKVIVRYVRMDLV